MYFKSTDINFVVFFYGVLSVNGQTFNHDTTQQADHWNIVNTELNDLRIIICLK